MKRIAALTVLAISLLSGAHAETPSAKPNIVVLFLDDMAWSQPGCYGGKLSPTPNLDAIAANGVRFTNGYSSAPLCSPGRVGMITGRYQARTGHDANPTQPGRDLVLTETTMAQHFKEAGYTTGCIGKWHLGVSGPEYMPASRGFDYSMGTVGNIGEGKGPSYYRGTELLKEMDGAPITSPVYAREACQFIDANKEKPFFLYLSFNAVHSPHVASKAWLEKFSDLGKHERGYAALIGEADEAIGTVMTKLRELKLEENTLVFCVSDNGGASPLGEQMGLRGHKWLLWEGGIRVTWMAQWKGHIPPGRVLNQPVIQLDVLPTALAASNSAPKDGVQLDGINLLPLLEGKTDKLDRDTLYFRFGVQYAIRQADWKLVKASKDMEPMLVNLANDPSEQKDLSAENPTKKAELQTLWDKWNATMQAPRWEDARWNGEDAKKALPDKKKDAKKSAKHAEAKEDA